MPHNTKATKKQNKNKKIKTKTKTKKETHTLAVTKDYTGYLAIKKGNRLQNTNCTHKLLTEMGFR